MAPRKPIAESANMPPEASPISVGRMPPTPPGIFVDMITTPEVATMMAVIIGTVSVSPRNNRPKTATWIGSVLM